MGGYTRGGAVMKYADIFRLLKKYYRYTQTLGSDYQTSFEKILRGYEEAVVKKFITGMDERWDRFPSLKDIRQYLDYLAVEEREKAQRIKDLREREILDRSFEDIPVSPELEPVKDLTIKFLAGQITRKTYVNGLIRNGMNREASIFIEERQRLGQSMDKFVGQI